jgi:hypothetical protein
MSELLMTKAHFQLAGQFLVSGESIFCKDFLKLYVAAHKCFIRDSQGWLKCSKVWSVYRKPKKLEKHWLWLLNCLPWYYRSVRYSQMYRKLFKMAVSVLLMFSCLPRDATSQKPTISSSETHKIIISNHNFSEIHESHTNLRIIQPPKAYELQNHANIFLQFSCKINKKVDHHHKISKWIIWKLIL